jgi:hypothetical protein
MSDDHGADEYCRVCNKAIRLRANMLTGRSSRFVCCNGRDCGCGGGRLPDDVCSAACFEDEVAEDKDSNRG